MTDYNTLSKEIRKKVLTMGYKSQEGHIGCALSCVDILTTLYFGVLKIDPANPLDVNRDRLVFSKGHAATALYATLCQRGFFPSQVLETYCQNGEKLAGHTTRGSAPGIEVTSGSLGHGFPMAVGMALALKKDKKSSRVFALISDGECDEGTTWESALFSGHQALEQLTLIIDYNKIQGFGRTDEVMGLEPLAKKFEAFGWAVKEVNGHDFAAMQQAFLSTPLSPAKPTVIICHTIKGKGVSFMENTLESHYTHLRQEDYEKSIAQLT